MQGRYIFVLVAWAVLIAVDGFVCDRAWPRIDVFESEPLPADHPLTQFDQVLLSPHIAGLTDGAAQKMAIGSAKNIVDFFAGTVDPALIVNREQLHGAS